MIKRRCVTLPALWLATCLALAFYLPLLILAFIASALRPMRSAPRVLSFVVCYLVLECAGVARLAWVWLRHRHRDDWVLQNRLVQIWWANTLLKVGEHLFSLRFEVSGQEALEGPSALVFVRHSSIGDTVLPFPYYSVPRANEGMRYIIKKELLISPSLDIGGHRLSTLFIDRSLNRDSLQLEKLAEITASAPQDESVLIYPEGTRNSAARRAQIVASHPELQSQLERWPDLLPPRLGGARVMLESNPGKDVVFIAHTGFEGSANLAELMSGSWTNMTIRIHTWRIPYAEIGDDHDTFMYDQWDEMQRVVTRLK